MAKLRKGDTVSVIAGKDKGKKGKVLKSFVKEGKLIVEGVNLVKKHLRPNRENPKGGIVPVEKPIQVSNVMLNCPKCAKNTRLSAKILTDGTKQRICKKCQEII